MSRGAGFYDPLTEQIMSYDGKQASFPTPEQGSEFGWGGGSLSCTELRSPPGWVELRLRYRLGLMR